MNITDYDRNIKPHLVSAQEHAYRASREISRLPARPDFFTLTQDELEHARIVLEMTLANVITALEVYETKPLESDL